MGERLTWEEVRQRYPDQWVSLGEVERALDGTIQAGIVVAVGSDLKAVAEASKGQSFTSHQFKYTGTITNFLGFSKWTIGNVSAH